MKKSIAVFLLLSASSAFAGADFRLPKGAMRTIEVDDCAKDETSQVSLVSLAAGGQGVTGRCLPAICTYTNETPWPMTYKTKWTIEVKGQTEAKRGPLTDPQFDRSPGMVRTLNTGVKTKEARDALLKKYLSEGVCQGTFYDQKIQDI
jgi:hypothetical protein